MSTGVRALPVARRSMLRLCAAAGLLAITGCAPEVIRTATSFSPVATGEPVASIRIEREDVARYRNLYDRPIPVGSTWIRIGRIAEGDVYRRTGDVFTVEGAHIHEAGLVLRGSTLAGFYLLAEGSFVPISPQIPLQYTESR